MPFTPIRRPSIAEQVATTLRGAILEGRFQTGQSLPSERDLAEQFEINRSTVREALHRLEAWGLVEMRHGGGTRIRDFLSSAGFQLLPYLLAPNGAVDPKLLHDLLEIRCLLLGWTAKLAAQRATPEQITALQATLLQIEQHPEQVQELDWQFFEILVAMSHNQVLGLLANAIRQVYLENRSLFATLYAGGFDPAHHRATVAAILARDSVAAEAAMTKFGGAYV